MAIVLRNKKKFSGLNVALSKDVTETGKPRFIFYAYTTEYVFRREVHANNLTAAAGAALKVLFKTAFKNRTPVQFLMGDARTASKSNFVKAVWLGRVTATNFAIFEPFGEATRKPPAKKAASKSTTRAKSGVTTRSQSKSAAKSTTRSQSKSTMVTRSQSKAATKSRPKSNNASSKKTTNKPKTKKSTAKPVVAKKTTLKQQKTSTNKKTTAKKTGSRPAAKKAGVPKKK